MEETFQPELRGLAMVVQQLGRRSRLALVMTLLAIMMAGSHVANGQDSEAGDIMTDEFGVEMVYVPGATFTMGIEGERLRELCEQRGESNPDRCVEIIGEESGATYLQTDEIQPFWIDRFEVTIEQFNEFCGRDPYTDLDDCLGTPRDVALAQSPRQPQVGVSWYTANYICSLRYARLPTEAEWEYAASGPDKVIYPWGDTYVQEYIRSSDSQYPQTYPVGSISENQSWIGAFDMAGNVGEWTDDRFATRILASLSVNEWPAALPGNRFEISRVMRGGSSNSPYWYYTNFYRTNGSSELLGFRCVRSLLP